MIKTQVIISVAGSGSIRFEPGHYCGKKYGFGVNFENWIVKESLRGHDGYSAGGVLDFKDIEKLYVLAKQYQAKYKRLSTTELLKHG